MLNAGLFPLLGGEEGGEIGQPFLGTGDEILSSERIGQLLQRFWIATLEESIGALVKADTALAHPVSEPIMLIQAHAGGEGEVGTDAHKDASPVPVMDVEVVLVNPAPLHLQMPNAGLSRWRS